MTFNASRWVIESDIRKCFDRIDHKLFLAIISKRITCPITLRLINSALKVRAPAASRGRESGPPVQVGGLASKTRDP